MVGGMVFRHVGVVTLFRGARAIVLLSLVPFAIVFHHQSLSRHSTHQWPRTCTWTWEFSHEDKVVTPIQFSSKPMKSKLPSLLQIQRTEWALTTNSKLVTSWWRWITSVKIELVTRYYTNTKWVRRWLITERFQADLWVLTTHPQVLVTVTKVVVRALPKEYWGGDRVLIRWVFRSHPKC